MNSNQHESLPMTIFAEKEVDITIFTISSSMKKKKIKKTYYCIIRDRRIHAYLLQYRMSTLFDGCCICKFWTDFRQNRKRETKILFDKNMFLRQQKTRK